MNIGILGTGRVATNLATGLAKAGHAVKLGSREPQGKAPPAKNVSVGTQADAVKFGDAVILAVPYSAVPQTVAAVGAGAFKGKTVIDATNAFPAPAGWGAATSCAEEVAKLLPGANVAKAFNTVFAANMSTGRVGSAKLAGLVAANDDAARKTALRLNADLGFDPVDAGSLDAARYMEGLALLNIRLGLQQKMGTNIGFALVH